MHISRKQALVALVAGVIPWISRRAHAELAAPPTETLPRATPAPTQAQFDALLKRVAELEKQLASQVAFKKDAAGNLSLDTQGGVSIRGQKLTLKSAATTELVASGMLTVKGSVINLN